MTGTNKHTVYTNEALGNRTIAGNTNGQVSWACPSNIALIKYWGKKTGQLPANASISAGLSQARTIMEVAYEYDNLKPFHLKFLFEDAQHEMFQHKIETYLLALKNYFPFIPNTSLTIRSANTFPHSAGIASSASAFGALALAICNIEQKLLDKNSHDNHFFQKASFMARLGSGSACRSVHAGYCVWGTTKHYTGTSDECAVAINHHVHPVFQSYKNYVLIINSAAKPVSSRSGHALMEHNVFASSRYRQADQHTESLKRILELGDVMGFATIVEHEALSLHAMMMTSQPSTILMKPNTISAMERIRAFRESTEIPVCFTLDAGPNVHMLFPAEYEPQVAEFAGSNLLSLCENGQIIKDGVGQGPVELN
jgi:diphosphomevalonate decarboxylase